MRAPGPDLGVSGELDGGPHFVGNHLRQIFGALVVQSQHALEQFQAVSLGSLRKGRERRACRADRARRVRRIAHGNRGDRSLGGRIDHRQSGGTQRLHPGPIDIEIAGIFHAPMLRHFPS